MTTMRGQHILLGLLLGMAGISMAQAATATRTSAFVYDAATGLMTKEIIEPDLTQMRLETTYTYDGWGNKTVATTSSPATGSAAIVARSSSTGYDTRGQFPISSTNALTHVETKVIDPKFGVMTKLTGPNALITQWQYDSFGRKILETRADGNKTKWDYLFCSGVNGGTTPCPAGAKYMAQVTPLKADGITANGAWSKSYYDMLGRQIRAETLGLDGTSVIVQSTEYDSMGRVARSSAPYYSNQAPVWTVPTYDALSRATITTFPDTSKTTVTYNGLRISSTNDLNQTQTKVSNSQGKVIQVIDAKNATSNYEYDAIGNLTKTIDPDGNMVTLVYDLRGRKIQMIDPDMGTWGYEYNALGELTKQTDAKAQVTTMLYDKLGRMTKRTEADLVSTWTYDTCTKGKGKLCSATADNGYTRTHTYDTKGRASSTTTNIDVSYVTSVTYNTDGRIATQTYPTVSGLKLKYVYTTAGYLKEVRNNATNALYWQADTMDAQGHLLQQTYGNGVVTQQVFDINTGRLKNIYAGAGNGVQNLSYTYDNLGNLLTRNDATQNLNESFIYDNLNRVTSATVNSSGAGLVTQSFTYNSSGNIITRSDVGTYTYGPLNNRPHAVAQINLAGGGTRQYTYDANGSLTNEVQRDASNNIIAAKGRTEVYTSFAMPQAIASNGYSAAFAYGPEHQRVKQIAPTVTTIYLNPGNSDGLLYEKDMKSDGSTEHRSFITAGGQVIAVAKKVIKGSTTTNSVVYFHRDQLGSTTAVTNAAGAVIERLAYEAFGKRRQPAGNLDPTGTIAGVNTTRGYTNHEHLDPLGLIHMNGRIYDPVIGRFMSADPYIQSPDNAQSYNRYSYVMNNPLNSTDPSGYFSWKGILSGGWEKSGGDPRRALFNFHRSQPGQSYIDHYVMTHSWAYSVGQVAVTAVATWACWGNYACGAGAAATYAAYYTYEATGSLSKAEKAGAVTFVTTYASSYVANAGWNAPTTVVAQGTIGGTAAKLQGGDFEQGFMYAAASASLNEVYKSSVKTDASLKTSDGTYAEKADGVSLHPVKSTASNMGIKVEIGSTQAWALDMINRDVSWNKLTMGTEAWAPLRWISSRIPGMEGISRVHDVWGGAIERAGNWNIATNVGAMLPAAVVTYGGAMGAVPASSFAVNHNPNRRDD